MKHILLVILSLFLMSCSVEFNNKITDKEHTRIKQDAEIFCACHGGVIGFVYNSNAYELICKDGISAKGTGDIRNQRFYSSCGVTK